MPNRPGALPTELGAHFTTAEARRYGLSHSRLASADLVAPFHGVRRRRSDLKRENEESTNDTAPLAQSRTLSRSIRSAMLAYLQVMPSGAFLCGRSAAAFHGYPVPPPADLEIGVISPQRAPRGRGVSGRKMQSHLVEVELLDGMPISTPATTWAMLGRELSERRLTVLADAIVHVPRDRYAARHPELAGATLEQLQKAAHAGRRVGVQRLRDALARARIGSASPLETEYRLDAEDAGLPEPELDVEIRDGDGRLLGISEIVYREYRLIVEIEGDHHRTSRTQWNRDLHKYRDYANAGWEVVRITASNIRSERSAVGIVRSALRRRGWSRTR